MTVRMGGALTGQDVYQRLYVGSIHFSLTEDDIRQIFEPFGPLDFVNLHKGNGPLLGAVRNLLTAQFTARTIQIQKLADPRAMPSYSKSCNQRASVHLSRSLWFTRYKNAADGKQALEKMNGFDLAGRNVSYYNLVMSVHMFPRQPDLFASYSSRSVSSRRSQAP